MVVQVPDELAGEAIGRRQALHGDDQLLLLRLGDQ